jgi:hypothetical protein
VVQGKRDAPVFKKSYEIVHILKRRTAGRRDYRRLGLCYLLYQHPVVDIGTRQFYYRHVQFDTEIDRFFVERRRHGNAARGTDVFGECGKIFSRHLCIERLLDVSKVRPIPRARVNEVVNVAELKLYCGANIVVTHDSRKIGNDPPPSLQPAPMIVSEFEDEELLEDVSMDRHDYWFLTEVAS